MVSDDSYKGIWDIWLQLQKKTKSGQRIDARHVKNNNCPTKTSKICKRRKNFGLNRPGWAQVWNIACHFYLPSLRCAVTSWFDRMLLGHALRKLYYPYYFYFNNLVTSGCCILSIKIIAKYNKNDFVGLIIFCVDAFCLLHMVQQSRLIFLILKLKCVVVTVYNQSLWQ